MVTTETRSRRAKPSPKVRKPGRIFRIFGVACLIGAVGLGAYYVWYFWGTGIVTNRAQAELREGFETLRRPLPPRLRPSEDEIKAPGGAYAVILIPRIELDMVVVEGTDTEALKKGPGHYVETADPWDDTGRVGIAGHRTTYGAPFWSLDAIRPGDSITLATRVGTYEYRVTGSEVAKPPWDRVLKQTDEPTLVLTTCNPRFSSAERLFVYADRV